MRTPLKSAPKEASVFCRSPFSRGLPAVRRVICTNEREGDGRPTAGDPPAVLCRATVSSRWERFSSVHWQGDPGTHSHSLRTGTALGLTLLLEDRPAEVGELCRSTGELEGAAECTGLDFNEAAIIVGSDHAVVCPHFDGNVV